MIANVLSIAGSDPSGGAGIQADLKAFAACGVYGMAAITALTAQNTRGVTGALPIPPDFVAAQIGAVLADVRVDAVKIGMLASADIAAAVADALADCAAPIVLDPVMVAKGGAALLGAPVARDRAGMAAQARALLAIGPACVLLKGGHLDGPDSPDLVATAEGEIWLEGPRTPTRNTHGTGCTLSSAMAAFLARGATARAAAEAAKRYVAGAIEAADALDVGSGHGPVNHFYALWRAGSS